MIAAGVAAVVGVIGLLAWAFVAAADMPSYLAGWLLGMAVPVGMLPIVMGLEAAGLLDWPVLAVLRRTLLLLPLGAVLAIPVLLTTGPLYRRPGIADALPAGWMAPGVFVTRMLVILIVLSLLAVVFSRPPAEAPRRGLAVLGLLMHLWLVSLAAVDWIMALQPGLGSSAFGLLVIASQLGMAASLAAFVVAVGTPRAAVLPAAWGPLLAVVLVLWLILQFGQFLVVWSANLPAEIVWYQARAAGGGAALVWSAAAASALALALLPSPLARRPVGLACVAGMLLAMHALEMLWLVTPAFRGQFVISLADVLAVLGVGGLLSGLLLVLLPSRSAQHVPA